mgnify:CR=1 FL=1
MHLKILQNLSWKVSSTKNRWQQNSSKFLLTRCALWMQAAKSRFDFSLKKHLPLDLASAILTVASKAQQCFRLCRFCKHFFCPLQLRLSCLTWKYVGSNQSWTYFLKMVYRIQQFCFFRIHFSAQSLQKLYMQTFRVFCCLCE